MSRNLYLNLGFLFSRIHCIMDWNVCSQNQKCHQKWTKLTLFWFLGVVLTVVYVPWQVMEWMQIWYTAKLLFRQSPTRHSDYTLTGQWLCSPHCYMYVTAGIMVTTQLLVVTVLPTVVNNSDFTVTIQPLCSHCAYSLIAFDERVTFWLQRVRSLPCACV